MARKLIVEIVGDSRQLEKTYARAASSTRGFGHDVQAAGRGAVAATVGFHGLGRSIAFASASFLGGVGFVSVVKSSVEAASNLNEQMAKTEVVFGTSGHAVEEWASTAAASMGLARGEALETASSIGALLRPMGFATAAASEQSTKLVQLGADLASFYNTSVADALQAIQSGLVGQVRPLRRYGVALDAARVAAEALRVTHKKSALELTNQEKVTARIAIIMRDTSLAQGDFARTSENLANQQRILRANLLNLMEDVGGALIPVITQIVSGMNEWLGKSENQERVTRDVKRAVDELVDVGTVLLDLVGKLQAAFDEFADAVGGSDRAIRLLIAGIAVGKLARLIGIFGAAGAAGGGAAAAGGIAGGAALATINVSALRLALLRLGAIGVVTVGVELIMEHAGQFGRYSGSQGWGKLFGDIKTAITNVVPSLKIFSHVEPPPPSWQAFFDSITKLSQQGNVAAKLKAVEAGITAISDAALVPSAFKGTAFGVGGAKPTAAQMRAIALAQYGGTGGAGEVAAINAQIAYDLAAIAFARKRLAAERGNRQAMAKELADRLSDLNSQRSRLAAIRDAQKAAAQQAADAARQEKLDAAQLAIDRADATKTLRDDLAAYLVQRSILTRQLAADKDNLDLQSKLVANAKTITDLRKQMAVQLREQRAQYAARFAVAAPENFRRYAQAAEQRAQFRALGLTATGEQPLPTVAQLRKQLGAIEEAIKGTVYDTPKRRSVFSGIAKDLSGFYGKVRGETKKTIKQILDDADALLKTHERVPVAVAPSVSRLVAGLGLSPDALKILRSRLAGAHLTVNPRGVNIGRDAVVVDNRLSVQIDGRQVAIATRKHAVRGEQRAASQTRGRQTR